MGWQDAAPTLNQLPISPAYRPDVAVHVKKPNRRHAAIAFARDNASRGLGMQIVDKRVKNLYGEAFGKFVGAEIRRWAEVVKNSGAKLD